MASDAFSEAYLLWICLLDICVEQCLSILCLLSKDLSVVGPCSVTVSLGWEILFSVSRAVCHTQIFKIAVTSLEEKKTRYRCGLIFNSFNSQIPEKTVNAKTSSRRRLMKYMNDTINN